MTETAVVRAPAPPGRAPAAHATHALGELASFSSARIVLLALVIVLYGVMLVARRRPPLSDRRIGLRLVFGLLQALVIEPMTIVVVPVSALLTRHSSS